VDARRCGSIIPTCDPCNTERTEAAALLDLDIATSECALIEQAKGLLEPRTAGRPAQRGAMDGQEAIDLLVCRHHGLQRIRSARLSGNEPRDRMRVGICDCRGAGLRRIAFRGLPAGEALCRADAAVAYEASWRRNGTGLHLTTQHSLDACGSHAFDGPEGAKASGMVDLNLPIPTTGSFEYAASEQLHPRRSQGHAETLILL